MRGKNDAGDASDDVYVAEEEPLSLEDLAKADDQGLKGFCRSIPFLNSSAFGFLQAWLFVACFSRLMYAADGVDHSTIAASHTASFAAFVACLFAVVAFQAPLMRHWRKRVCAAAAAVAACTAVLAMGNGLAVFALPPAFSVGLSVVQGFCAGYMFVCWSQAYVFGRSHPTLQIAGAFIGAFALTALALLLPFEGSIAVSSAYPLLAGVLVAHSARVAKEKSDSSSEIEPKPIDWLPARFSLALLAMGFAYGLAYGFVADMGPRGDEAAIACLVADGAVGAFLLCYALATHRNFGFSVWAIGVLPLACVAQCGIVGFREDYISLSFFLMRAAFELFAAVLWLQLPNVYKRSGSIRTFLMARGILDGGALAGIVVRAGLSSGFDYFGIVSFATFVVLIAALTVCFSGTGVTSAWRFLVPEKVERKGYFATACEQIEDAYDLTNREGEIMRYVLRGRSGSHIQEKLVISKSTYQTHMRNLYKKLDVHSNQELIDLLEEQLDKNMR